MPIKFEITPGRRTYVELDTVEYVLRQQGIWIHRYAKDLVQTRAARTKDVTLHGETCWQLEPVNVDINAMTEHASHQDSILAPGPDAQTPPGFLARPMNAKASDLPGALDGASPDLQVNGDKFMQKQVSASTEWNDDQYNLAADQASFPGDTDDANIIVLDRVMATKSDFDQETGVIIRFSVDGGKLGAKQLVNALSFTGPRSQNKSEVGYGQYTLRFYGDGRAELKEKRDLYDANRALVKTQYVKVFEFRYSAPNQVAGHAHAITMIRHIFRQPVGTTSGFFSFSSEGTGSTPNFSAGGGLLAVTATRVERSQTYFVKWQQGKGPAGPSEKLRLDQPRDVRPLTQVTKVKYKTSGYLFDDPQALISETGWPDSDGTRLIYVTWFGKTNDKTHIDVDLYTYGDTPEQATVLTSVGSGAIGSEGAWKAYDLEAIPGNFPTVQVKVSMSTDDAFQTPSLYSIRISKKAVIDQTAATPFTLTCGVQGLSIVGPESDPSHESAEFVVDDLFADYPLLRHRSNYAVKISTTYQDPTINWSLSTNDVKRSVLFFGHLETPRIRYPGVADPMSRFKNGVADRVSVQASCQGLWARLGEAFSQNIVDFGWARDEDTAAGNSQLPWKATDAIRYAFRSAGFPDSMLDIPDLAVRLFPNAQEGIRVDPGASWLEFIRDTAEKYLAAAVIFDPNAGPTADSATWLGMWRLIMPPTDPYDKPVAYFSVMPTYTGPANKAISAAETKAYPDKTVNSRTIKGTFIEKHQSMVDTIKKPAANYILVVGGASKDSPRTTCVSVNPKSYKAIDGQGDPDPTHPDYIGRQIPLYYFDGQLSSENEDLNEKATRFVAARLFQKLAHAEKTLSFMAPLLLITDPDDTKQRRPRPLRPYDTVVVYDMNKSPYKAIVRSCNPIIEKDVAQMAHYELLFPYGTAADIHL